MKSVELKFPFEMYAISGEGRLVNARTHDAAMEIVQIISGKVIIVVGTERREAAKGDILYIPPTMVFRADSLGGKASIRGMKFDSSILEANMENFDAEVFYMFYLQSKSKIAHFKSDSPVYEALTRCMQESYDEYVAKEICYKLPIRANIYLMMTTLLRYYCGSKDESDKMIYHNVLRLRPVMDYIAEHYCEKIYIEKLSEMIGVSADYFTKMFKDSIGKTPIEYINGLRVNRAMQLLCDTDISMAEIAESTGFCNPNYFHKIFKQYMDTSPLAYRKSTK